MKQLTLCLCFCISALMLSAQSLVIQTSAGKVEGLALEDGIEAFKGIPFASPPVGDNRWKAPQPVKPWDGVLECKSFGPSPMQAAPSPFMFWSSEFLIPEEPISEDCLYLNVWTRNRSSDALKPVLVYIYGGGFRSGGSGCPIYDGKAVAEKDVLFVTINYRVGVFGFLAHPELSAESPDHTSGNYALLDMVAALQWVQENIEQFGGDPANVTIAGQSAGAFAVNYLTVMPEARGLFHKAIAQSGGSFYGRGAFSTPGLEQAEEQGAKFAEDLGVSSLADLRSQSAERILLATGGTQGPIVDGIVVPASIYEIYLEGSQSDVPMLMGWNEEDVVFTNYVGAEEFGKQLSGRFGSYADSFKKLYPAHSEEEAVQSQIALSRDQVFGSQVFTWALMQEQTGDDPVYLYNFNRSLPAYGPETEFGAFHSGELVYAYDNLATLDRPWEPVDQYIATIMSQYWVNFARQGNPNGPGVPEWQPFGPEYKVQVIDAETRSEVLPDLSRLQLWRQYLEEQRQ